MQSALLTLLKHVLEDHASDSYNENKAAEHRNQK